MDSHDEDDGDFMFLLLLSHMAMVSAVAVFFVYLMPDQRDPSMFVQRFRWGEFISRHRRCKDFHRHLRMHPDSFEKLLEYIRHDLKANKKMASLRGGVIMSEIRLYCTLRYLAGGSYSDVYFFMGISRASFYRVVWQTIKAINKCKELEIKIPQTLEECAKAAAGFKSISFQECIDNCVYTCDGYHLQIVTPSKAEVGNVRSYFSGHYQTYGINIQAACDHLCRFVFLAVAAPGVTGDRDAINECGLYEKIESLPGLFTAIGDCAYKPTEHMAPIYWGSDATRPKCDNFNFYASQLRIRIEMAFGLMVKKWGILSRPLGIKVVNVKHLIVAIARLHNFCINERIARGGERVSFDAQDVQLEIMDRALREQAATIDAVSAEFPGWSLNRDRMAKKIKDAGLCRPSGNKGSGGFVHAQRADV